MNGLVTAIVFAAVAAAFGFGILLGRRTLGRRLQRGSIAIQRSRRAAAEARRNAGRFRQTVLGMADGTIVTDAFGRITMMNPAAEAIAGCSSDAAAGRMLSEVLIFKSIGSGEVTGAALTAALASGLPVRSDAAKLAVGRGGEETIVTQNVALLRRGGGEIDGAVLTLRDVSAELRRQREIDAGRELMNRVCTRMCMSFFRYDIASGVSKPIWNTDLFRLVSPDGDLVPAEQWLTPESFKRFSHGIRELRAGKLMELNIKIETCYRGINRWYHMFCVGAGNGNPDECLGMLADITTAERLNIEHLDTLTMLHSIIDNMPFPVFTKDVEANFLYLTGNRAMHRILSLPDGGAIGRGDYELMAAADAAGVRDNDRKLVESGRDMMTFEEKFDTPDGRTVCFNAIKQMLTLGNGRRIILGVSVDVSAEREAASRAESAMNMLRLIIENLPLNIYVKDFTDRNRFLYWNSELGGRIGLSGGVIGLSVDELNLAEDIRSELLEHDRAAVEAHGGVVARRMWMPSTGGGLALCDVYKRAVKSPEGHDLIIAMAIDADNPERIGGVGGAR